MRINGDKSICLIGYDTTIIVDNRIIDNKQLQWRYEDNGGIELTLDEIAEQLSVEYFIYVWIEIGVRGEIFKYNKDTNGDGMWLEHGITKGFA